MFVGQAVGTITNLSDFSTGEVCGHALYPTCLSARHLELLTTAYPSIEGPVSLTDVCGSDHIPTGFNTDSQF